MRIGLVVDSACDLPQDYIAEHRIGILPITVRIDNDVFVDERDPEATLRFFRDKLGQRGHAAETEAFGVEQIEALFLDRLVLDYDCVFCLTISSTRSLIHDNVQRASFSILKNYRPVRERAGIAGPFLMRVIDSRTLFAGQAPLAVAAVRMIGAGESPGQIRERLEFLARHAYGYMIPRDLYYLRARAQKKGDRSVGFLQAALGTALDIKPILRGHAGDTGPVGKARGFEAGAAQLFRFVVDRIAAGLLVPAVCVSYGGDLGELDRLSGYGDLKRTCDMHEIQLLASVMSITGMVNVGAGALTVGFAAENVPAFG